MHKYDLGLQAFSTELASQDTDQCIPPLDKTTVWFSGSKPIIQNQRATV